jgi:hypothetical protein
MSFVFVFVFVLGQFNPAVHLLLLPSLIPSINCPMEFNFMISLKALVIGLIVTVLVGLFGQAIYVLLASYIGMAASDYGFVSNYKQEIWFVFAILVFCLSMSFGGMVTATIANHKLVQHAAVVGFMASLASILSSTASGDLTLMAGIMIVLGTVFAALGGLMIKRAAS